MAGIVGADLPVVMEMYPNPATDNVKLDVFAQAGESYAIDIYSAVGDKIKAVYNGQLSKGTNTLDFSVSDLSAGIYVIRVENEEHVQTLKFIKK